MFRCSYCERLIVSKKLSFKISVNEMPYQRFPVCNRCAFALRKAILFMKGVGMIGKRNEN